MHVITAAVHVNNADPRLTACARERAALCSLLEFLAWNSVDVDVNTMKVVDVEHDANGGRTLYKIQYATSREWAMAAPTSRRWHFYPMCGMVYILPRAIARASNSEIFVPGVYKLSSMLWNSIAEELDKRRIFVHDHASCSASGAFILVAALSGTQTDVNVVDLFKRCYKENAPW